jgi:Xaa-Pro aminopeptidase
VPGRYRGVPSVAAARDAAVRLVRQAAVEGRLRGWRSTASSVLRKDGYSDHILHRTGHSLGESVRGNGVNMDDYETRRSAATPGTGFTIEPGVCFDDFGVEAKSTRSCAVTMRW